MESCRWLLPPGTTSCPDRGGGKSVDSFFLRGGEGELLGFLGRVGVSPAVAFLAPPLPWGGICVGWGGTYLRYLPGGTQVLVSAPPSLRQTPLPLVVPAQPPRWEWPLERCFRHGPSWDFFHFLWPLSLSLLAFPNGGEQRLRSTAPGVFPVLLRGKSRGPVARDSEAPEFFFFFFLVGWGGTGSLLLQLKRGCCV